MTIFKSGDRVRCIQEPTSQRIEFGQEFIVRDVDGDRVWLDRGLGWWYARRFELVKRADQNSDDLARALELKEQAEAQAAHFLAQREAAIKELEDLKGVIRALNRALKESL